MCLACACQVSSLVTATFNVEWPESWYRFSIYGSILQLYSLINIDIELFRAPVYGARLPSERTTTTNVGVVPSLLRVIGQPSILITSPLMSECCFRRSQALPMALRRAWRFCVQRD